MLKRAAAFAVPRRLLGAGRRSFSPLANDESEGLAKLSSQFTLTLEQLHKKKGFLVDMDGVLYHQSQLLPGAKQFVQWLKSEDKKFLFLTNGSVLAPRELQQKLGRLGIEVQGDNFYTSALATAQFLAQQKPGGSAFVIGESGLHAALYNVGYTMNDTDPDYVVVGETANYSYSQISHAIRLVMNGARLIGTNCDLADKTANGLLPSCGALVKPIELTSGVECYFVGKPNPLIMRTAINRLGISREDAVIVGDRMDTDIQAGVQTEIHTVLVLSGVSRLSHLQRYGFRPSLVLPSVAYIAPEAAQQ